MTKNIPSKLQDKELNIIQTGKWWITEIESIGIATQGESKEEALDKLEKRLEQYERRPTETPIFDKNDLDDPRLEIHDDINSE